MKKQEEQLTFADLDLPKRRGRPAKPEGEKLTPAQRAKRYRDKKRAQGVRLVPISAEEAHKLRPAARFSGLFALDARLAGKFE